MSSLRVRVLPERAGGGREVGWMGMLAGSCVQARALLERGEEGRLELDACWACCGHAHAHSDENGAGALLARGGYMHIWLWTNCMGR